MKIESKVYEVKDHIFLSVSYNVMIETRASVRGIIEDSIRSPNEFRIARFLMGRLAEEIK